MTTEPKPDLETRMALLVMYLRAQGVTDQVIEDACWVMRRAVERGIVKLPKRVLH
jgi:hypothetical protein